MSTKMRVTFALLLASALAFGLFAYFTWPTSETKQVSVTEPIQLAGPWKDAQTQWTVEGSVHSLVELPENVAFIVLKEHEDSQFYMYSPKGEVVAHVGIPESLKGQRYTTNLETAHVDGKMYLTVVQGTDYYLVVTGFDEDGKQLFHKETASTFTDRFMEFDPITGEIIPDEETYEKEGIPSVSEGKFDGVEVTRTVEVSEESYKSFISGAEWKREVPAGAYIGNAGAYLAITSTHDYSSSEDAPMLFRGGIPYCQIIDPHTGEDVKDANGVASSCWLSRGVSESNLRYNSAVITANESESQWSTASGASVLLPATGQSRDLSFEQHFSPYSIDTDGTIYGTLKTDDAEKPATTKIDSTDYPVFLKDADRVPVLITKSGIAAFPMKSVSGPETGFGSYIFAVK